MTKSLSLKATVVSLALVTLAFATMAAQYIGTLLSKSLADSAGIRVAAQNNCNATDTHFTGCSSIL